LQGVVVAQDKNGDELFWEEKFHAANGKPQACAQGPLHFFLLSLGGKDFFKKNSLAPNVLPICSHYVPLKNSQ